MRIEMENYTITAEPLNFILTPTKDLKPLLKGKPGRTAIRAYNSKYFSNIPDLLICLSQQLTKDSDQIQPILDFQKELLKKQEWVVTQFINSDKIGELDSIRSINRDQTPPIVENGEN